MKLKVVNPDGRIETIEIKNPMRIMEGEELNTLDVVSGLAHYFDKEGAYDGWATSCEIGPDDVE